MSILLKQRPKFRIRVTPERVLAVAAMTAVGIGLAQPSLVSMARLQDRPQTFAGHPIDPAPTGTIDQDAAARRRDASVSGRLSGFIKLLWNKRGIDLP